MEPEDGQLAKTRDTEGAVGWGASSIPRSTARPAVGEAGAPAPGEDAARGFGSSGLSCRDQHHPHPKTDTGTRTRGQGHLSWASHTSEAAAPTWESETSARSRTVGQSPAGHWLEGQPRRRPSCVRGAATGLPGFPAQHPPLPD